MSSKESLQYKQMKNLIQRTRFNSDKLFIDHSDFEDQMYIQYGINDNLSEYGFVNNQFIDNLHFNQDLSTDLKRAIQVQPLYMKTFTGRFISKYLPQFYKYCNFRLPFTREQMINILEDTSDNPAAAVGGVVPNRIQKDKRYCEIHNLLVNIIKKEHVIGAFYSYIITYIYILYFTWQGDLNLKMINNEFESLITGDIPPFIITFLKQLSHIERMTSKMNMQPYSKTKQSSLDDKIQQFHNQFFDYCFTYYDVNFSINTQNILYGYYQQLPIPNAFNNQTGLVMEFNEYLIQQFHLTLQQIANNDRTQLQLIQNQMRQALLQHQAVHGILNISDRQFNFKLFYQKMKEFYDIQIFGQCKIIDNLNRAFLIERQPLKGVTYDQMFDAVEDKVNGIRVERKTMQDNIYLVNRLLINPIDQTQITHFDNEETIRFGRECNSRQANQYVDHQYMLNQNFFLFPYIKVMNNVQYMKDIEIYYNRVQVLNFLQLMDKYIQDNKDVVKDNAYMTVNGYVSDFLEKGLDMSIVFKYNDEIKLGSKALKYNILIKEIFAYIQARFTSDLEDKYIYYSDLLKKRRKEKLFQTYLQNLENHALNQQTIQIYRICELNSATVWQRSLLLSMLIRLWEGYMNKDQYQKQLYYVQALLVIRVTVDNGASYEFDKIKHLFVDDLQDEMKFYFTFCKDDLNIIQYVPDFIDQPQIDNFIDICRDKQTVYINIKEVLRREEALKVTQAPQPIQVTQVPQNISGIQKSMPLLVILIASLGIIYYVRR